MQVRTAALLWLLPLAAHAQTPPATPAEVAGATDRASTGAAPAQPAASAEPAAATPATAPATAGATPALAATPVSVTGRVVLQGAPFARVVVAPRGLRACTPPPKDETWKVGADGALADAVVWVKDAKGATSPGQARVVLRACAPRPHVQTTTVGSVLVVVNEDHAHHHLHGRVKGASAFTVSMPLQGQVFTWKLDRPQWLELSCDAHPFERAIVAVFDHPFHAVTGEDGTFALSGVPAGEQEVVVRHEARDEQSRRVQAGAAPVRAEFELVAPPPPTDKP